MFSRTTNQTQMAPVAKQIASSNVAHCIETETTEIAETNVVKRARIKELRFCIFHFLCEQSRQIAQSFKAVSALGDRQVTKYQHDVQASDLIACIFTSLRILKLHAFGFNFCFSNEILTRTKRKLVAALEPLPLASASRWYCFLGFSQ